MFPYAWPPLLLAFVAANDIVGVMKRHPPRHTDDAKAARRSLRIALAIGLPAAALAAAFLAYYLFAVYQFLTR